MGRYSRHLALLLVFSGSLQLWGSCLHGGQEASGSCDKRLAWGAVGGNQALWANITRGHRACLGLECGAVRHKESTSIIIRAGNGEASEAAGERRLRRGGEGGGQTQRRAWAGDRPDAGKGWAEGTRDLAGGNMGIMSSVSWL